MGALAQRRFHRVSATCRVEYTGGNRVALGFTSQLGLGGMFLARARGLPVDAQLECALYLSEVEAPVTFRGVVRYATRDGVGVEFVDRPPASVRALRDFIEQESDGAANDSVLADFEQTASLERSLRAAPPAPQAQTGAELERLIRRMKAEELAERVAATPASELQLRPALPRAARPRRFTGWRPVLDGAAPGARTGRRPLLWAALLLALAGAVAGLASRWRRLPSWRGGPRLEAPRPPSPAVEALRPSPAPQPQVTPPPQPPSAKHARKSPRSASQRPGRRP